LKAGVIGMKQEIIAGIILGIMGLCMLLLPPKTLWKITDGWKTKGAGQPTEKNIVIMRVLGTVFTMTGGALLIWG